jgi:TPR repeat protein
MKRMLVAAQEGDANSQFNLGVVYDNGVDDNNHALDGNRKEAIKWLSLAAEQGLPRAQIKLAELYADRWASPQDQDYVKACTWFRLGMMSSIGIHREKAKSAYDRIFPQLTPAQAATVKRRVRTWKPARPDGGYLLSTPL